MPVLSRRERRLAAAMAAQLALIVAGQITSAARRPLPLPLIAELQMLGMGQDWRMFSPDTPRIEVRWRATGHLEDGRTVDILPMVAPRLGEQRSFFYSRWHRLRNGLVNQPPDLVAALGRYICRRWNGERAPPVLLRFELHADVKALLGSTGSDGEPLPPTEVRLRQHCQAGGSQR